MFGRKPAAPSSHSAEKEAPKLDEPAQPDAEPEAIQNPYFPDVYPPQNSKRTLPPFLDHFNARDAKKLLKSCVAVWIQTILILINPTLQVLGQAAFVGCLVLFLAPPAGNLFIQLFTSISVLLGLALGWAWGVIAMKAALATCPAAEVNARYALLQQMALNATHNGTLSSPTEYAQIQIFNGFMLDTRVTITYYCMVGLFIYLVCRLRVAAPKLILVQMMASIVSIIFLTDAPLLPTFQGTLPKSLIIPVAIAAGVSLVCNVFIFPTSASSEVLHGVGEILSPMPTFLDACLLGWKHPRLSMSAEVLMSTKLKIVMAYKALQPSTTFLPMDISIGRWSGNDLLTLGEPLREVVVSFMGLLDVQRAKEKHMENNAETEAVDSTSDGSPAVVRPGHHQVGRAIDFQRQSGHPNKNELMEKSLQALSTSSEKLMGACRESYIAIIEAISLSNSRSRAASRTEMLQKHTETLQELKENRITFVELTAQSLLEPHSHLFDENGFLRIEEEQFPPLTGFMMGLLFEDRLLQLADALETLLSRIVELESTRTKIQLWLPKRIMGLLGWISSTDDSENPIRAEEHADTRTLISATEPAKLSAEDKADKQKEVLSARAQYISMKTPNGRRRSKSSQILLKIIKWVSSTEGVFALRVVVVTLALSVPAVIRSSAGFYYREKGLWAVIMAQLAMAPYTGDLVFGIAVRIVGTVIGGVVGMVAWYIGAGNGGGNPYGIAAIMAVVIVIFMWWRLFSPPSLMGAGIMMAATAYLVVVYSWTDTHLPAYGDLGVGYSVFWRRVVLVLTGFAAAVIVTFLPRPPSANRQYRRVLADTLATVQDRYALFASSWKDPAPDLREVAEQEALAVGEILLSIIGPIKLTSFEFSTSNFNTDSLSQVCHLCIALNQSMTQLLVYSTRLSALDRAKIVPATGAVNPDLIAELMAVLALVQQALKSGDPLPAVIPTPLFAKAVALARQQIKETRGETDGFFVKGKMGDEGLRKYVVVLNALVQLLGTVDELVLVVKRAVGETSDVVFQEMV
ncbi:hypothetical protein BP5796_09376 [Coleophoma crateriformis]|uniref:ER transporter 6TM N-terminal domain-containing protein n=1 Tax=Coleophoma crateriformis TaxID=565419 RepID=A0A3D8QXX5_9HELO|nr:hypothetical protein BP5796_09376 [Coleophoma crateriformis]